jgi:hypothetical protein
MRDTRVESGVAQITDTQYPTLEDIHMRIFDDQIEAIQSQMLIGV